MTSTPDRMDFCVSFLIILTSWAKIGYLMEVHIEQTDVQIYRNAALKGYSEHREWPRLRKTVHLNLEYAQ